MSVVLICLPGAPKVSPEAVKREAELDKYLESRVEGRGVKLENSFLCLISYHLTWDMHMIILDVLVLTFLLLLM